MSPGTFSLTVYLKEALISEKLQLAVNDLMRRLPYINVRLCSGFIWYYHKPLKSPPKIISENNMPAICRYFEKGNNHLLRIIYGERHFTVEVFHTICDGRSLVLIVNSLLARYFELLGLTVSKEGLIDCDGVMHEDEVENAYRRYAGRKKGKSEKIINAYMPKFIPSAMQIITRNFDAAVIKKKATAVGATVTEYIIAHILKEFLVLRAKEGSKKPIGVNVPIDCRRLFPSKSLYPFVAYISAVMQEPVDFSDIVQDVKKQLTRITPNYIQRVINEYQHLIHIGDFVPLFISNFILRLIIGRGVNNGCSTWFSNLGIVNPPKEFQDRLESLSFSLCPDANIPYDFACITLGNTLTLTMSSTAKDIEIFDRLEKALK